MKTLIYLVPSTQVRIDFFYRFPSSYTSSPDYLFLLVSFLLFSYVWVSQPHQSI
ncbi:hypothetical protein BDV37DRAFT_264285, partial [Aspergillus pseudonomiae]